MADDFFKFYRRPEWQQKRLRVMEAAGWACQECATKDATFNVHHRFYKKGANPWEYEDTELVCLCEGCHERRHAALDKLKEISGWLSQSKLEALVGFAQARLVIHRDYKIGVAVESADEARGFAEALLLADVGSVPGVSAEDVLAARDGNGYVMPFMTAALHVAALADLRRAMGHVAADGERRPAADCRV